MNKLMKTVMAVAMAVGYTAFAAPSVKIDKIEDGDLWYKKTVTYTVDGITTGLDATLSFDVTAYGVTTNINKGAAVSGTFTETLDTAAIFGEKRKDPNAKIRVSVEVKGVQLWKDGPYWATCNVGAGSPEDLGYYFWWGDTVGYEHVGDKWVSVLDHTTTIQFSNEPPANGSYEISEHKVSFPLTMDAARKHLGAPWLMPGEDDYDGLRAYCTFKQETLNGVSGLRITGKTDGYTADSIFVPFTGYVVGSSFESENYLFWTNWGDGDWWIFSIRFTGTELDDSYDANSYNGLPVRAIYRR